MADHAHTTTAATLATLPDPVRSAVLERATAAQLTLPPDVPAYLTHSHRLTKPGSSRGSPRPPTPTPSTSPPWSSAARTSWSPHANQRGTAVLAARLEDVEVGSHLDRLAAAQGNRGVTITGFPVTAEGATSRGSFFVGLGAPDGQRAHAALDATVRQAKA